MCLFPEIPMTLRTAPLVGFCLLALVAIPVAQSAIGSGIEPGLADPSIRPQDDLFRHVNGGWLQRTEIPADRPTYGTFIQLRDKSEVDLRVLVEAQVGRPGRTAG